MSLLLVLAAFARPVDPASPEARLTSPLVEAWRASGDVRARAALARRAPRLAGDVVQVVVEVHDEHDVDTQIVGAGLVVEARWGRWVQGTVPPGRLAEVAALPGVVRVREPHRAEAKAVVSEGYAATMERDWHAEGPGHTGADVQVGVLDVGFGGADALAESELGGPVLTDFSRGAPEQTDHGTAVAEIVRDFAPDAELTLTSFSTEVEFGEALQALLDAQVDVVNCSVGFDNIWHADGSSPVTQYVDAMAAAGVIVTTAAGNEAQRYRVGELSAEAGSQYVNVGDHYAIAVTPVDGRVRASFRWSEPFGEAAIDLDLVAFADDGQRECGRSENPQDGDDDPLEELDVQDCGELAYVAVYTGLGTDVAGLTGHLYVRTGLAAEEATGASSLSLPADCFDCFAIGAYDAADDTIAAYSSRGPTDDGRTKPDFVAPTGVSTATYGEAGFSGSSAATPHAAGLAALWVGATGLHSEPATFGEWAADEARDLGAAGFDDASGHGALAADALPPGACGCASGGAAPGGLVVGATLGAVALVRRLRQ